MGEENAINFMLNTLKEEVIELSERLKRREENTRDLEILLIKYLTIYKYGRDSRFNTSNRGEDGKP